MSEIQVSGTCPHPASRPTTNSQEAQDGHLFHFYSKHLGKKHLFLPLPRCAHTSRPPGHRFFFSRHCQTREALPSPPPRPCLGSRSHGPKPKPEALAAVSSCQCFPLLQATTRGGRTESHNLGRALMQDSEQTHGDGDGDGAGIRAHHPGRSLPTTSP